MKKLLIPFLIAIIVLPSLNSKAQTWGAPVLIETPAGTGGIAGQHTSLIVVNGNPAMAYYDQTHESLMYIRATDINGTIWAAPVSVDVAGHVGQFNSLQIVNGNPAIAYYDVTNGDLKYVRASDVNGTIWTIPVSIDVTGEVGQFTSMQIVNGMPAIAYYNVSNKDLKYVRAADVNGLGWNTPVIVDHQSGWPSAPYGATYTSMQIVNGKPAISYYSRANNIGDLKYVRAADVDGTLWDTPVKVDLGGDVGRYTSLQIVNGNPAIAYTNSNQADLKYVRATDINGTAWGTPVILEDQPGGPSQPYGQSYISLQIVNSKPAVAWHNYLTRDLQYVAANDVDGTTWGSPNIIDFTGNVGQYASLQIVNGNPAIAYHDDSNGNLKYVQASDITGTNWNMPVSFDAMGNAGHHTSAQLVNGNPAVAYYDVTNSDLKYVRASNTNGSAWSQPASIDAVGNVGYFISMQTVNGNPAVSYYDIDNLALKFASASDANGSAWNMPVTVDATGNAGHYTSLLVVNGMPAISYYDVISGDLKYVRASNANGSAWNPPVSIDVTGDVGQYTSLQTVNGMPAISYYDYTNGDLKYARATDASGTTWGTPVSIDVTGFVGWYTSLQIVNGMPAISYYDASNDDLKYVRAVNADGTVWETPVSVDITGNVGQYTSLQVINGNPAISYYDVTNGNLKYVRATNASGTAWADDRISIDVTGNVGQYTSMIPMGTGAGIAYYNPSKAFPYFILGTSCTSSNNPTQPTLSSASTAICKGSSTTLSANGTLHDAAEWQWYSIACEGASAGIGTGITVAPTSTTTYYVRGEGGCITPGTCESITVIVNPLPDITTTINGVIISANQSGAIYQWLDCNSGMVPILNATNQSYTGAANGNYAVVVTLNGCSDTSACVNLNALGIPTLSLGEGAEVKLFPNPSNGMFTVIIGGTEEQSISEAGYSIINELGQTIQVLKLNAINNYTIHIENLNKGIYFITGLNNNQMICQKIIIY